MNRHFTRTTTAVVQHHARQQRQRQRQRHRRLFFENEPSKAVKHTGSAQLSSWQDDRQHRRPGAGNRRIVVPFPQSNNPARQLPLVFSPRSGPRSGMIVSHSQNNCCCTTLGTSIYQQQQQLTNRASCQGTTRRTISSWIAAPEFVQDFTIWGGTGVIIKSLHSDLGLPYWACFASMNVMLRASLLPLVVYGAHTAARYAKVAPEIQFIVTLFQNDLKKMRAEGKRSLYEQRHLFTQNLQTVKSIYQLHQINPLTVFLSPFLQIPMFYYVATDLRKIVNGSDPTLAQELTESPFLWLLDLTDPDPWFGLPILAGAMLYFNVEVAIGRRSLSGPSTSKSDFAGLLKDGFQTLAVFMPCFSAQSPAGLQIYLVSSFTWTLFQSAALRSDGVRDWLGLPPMGNPPTEPKFAKEFMEFKKLEQRARDIRGDGPVLGKNVLAVGFETSFPGTKNRPSTIEGSSDEILEQLRKAEKAQREQQLSSSLASKIPQVSMEQASAAWGGQYIHGISAPMKELEGRLMDSLREERVKEVALQTMNSEQNRDMEAANLGVKMVTAHTMSSSTSTSKGLGSSFNTLNPTKYKRRKGTSSLGGKKKYSKTKRKR